MPIHSLLNIGATMGQGVCLGWCLCLLCRSTGLSLSKFSMLLLRGISGGARIMCCSQLALWYVLSKWDFVGLMLVESSWVLVWSVISERRLIRRKRQMLLIWINLNLGRLYAMMSSMMEQSLILQYGELDCGAKRICPLIWCRNLWSLSIHVAVLQGMGWVSSNTGHIMLLYSWYCWIRIWNVCLAVSLIHRCLRNCNLCCMRASWPRCLKSTPPLAAAAYVMACRKVLGYPNSVRNAVVAYFCALWRTWLGIWVAGNG